MRMNSTDIQQKFSFNIYPLFSQDEQDVIPCSEADKVDDVQMFPALQPDSDSDSINFPFINNVENIQLPV